MKIRLDNNGVHLFDRLSGLNLLFDEIVVPDSRIHPAPRFVSMALTNACDLQCSFCYAPKHIGRLPIKTVIRWAMELDDGGCMGIGLGGGEPTLHPDFVAICKKLSTETNLAVSFTTHGHHLTSATASELYGSVHFLRLSMDGYGETYAQLRGRSFPAFLEKIKLAKTIAPFGINYVVNDKTIQHLDSAAQIIFDLGAVELLLLPERPVGNRKPLHSLTWERLLDWIKRNQDYRIALSDTPSLEGIPILSPFSDSDGLTAYAHIDASGNLRQSSFSSERVRIRSSVQDALAILRGRRSDLVE